MTSFRERGVECLLNRTRIAQVEVDRIQSRHLRNALRVARRAPHFIATCEQGVRDGPTNSRTGTGEKDPLHHKSLVERLWCNHPTRHTPPWHELLRRSPARRHLA